jgi:UbiD family decarboxylase
VCRVKEQVNWDLEVGAIMQKTCDTQGPALLFENVKGSPYPLFTGAMYTYRRYGLGIGVEGGLRPILRKGLHAMQNPIPPLRVASGPCQENVLTGKDIDLYRFPVPRWHEMDGGRYIGTLGVVVTRDPQTGERNMGIYRQQIMSRDTTGLLATQQVGTMFQKYRAMGKPMPIATAIGVPPEVVAAACFHAPYGQDELGIAGGLRGEPVPLVKCKTVDLEVPATSEIVLEGVVEVDTSLWKEEGPFGEYPGYYGGVKMPRPLVRLTAITHRNNPIFQGAMVVAPPCEDSTLRTVGHTVGAWGKLLTMGIPGVKELHMTEMGCAVFKVIVSMDRQYYGGNARQVINGVWASMGVGKWVIVVDDDIDIFDPGQVEWALSTRVQPHRDIIIVPDQSGSQLDPSIDPSKRPYPIAQTSRIGIDATMQFKGFEFPPKARPGEELMRTVEKKWAGKG